MFCDQKDNNVLWSCTLLTMKALDREWKKLRRPGHGEKLVVYWLSATIQFLANLIEKAYDNQRNGLLTSITSIFFNTRKSITARESRDRGRERREGVFLVRKNSLRLWLQHLMIDTQIRGDSVTKRKKERSYATGIITEVIRLQQIGRSPMYELRYAKCEFRVEGMDGGNNVCSRQVQV